MQDYKMNVIDIFFLSNKQIIVAGNIDSERLIPNCKCNLYHNDVFQEELICVGENIVKKTNPDNKIRSISIESISKLNNKNVHEGIWIIKFIV